MYIFTKKVGFQQVYSSVLNVSKVPYPMCECGRITGELKPASSLSLTLNKVVLSLSLTPNKLVHSLSLTPNKLVHSLSPTLRQLVLSHSPNLSQLLLVTTIPRLNRQLSRYFTHIKTN